MSASSSSSTARSGCSTCSTLTATACSLPNSFPQAELEQATGSAPVAWEAVASRGYGRINAHWRVQLADGRRAFVKVALDELAAGWLRDEHRIYAAVTGSFLPALLGWYDEHTTLLAIEDLGDAFWPPPWTDERIAAVRRALAELHAKPAPPGTPALESIRETFAGWPLVADDTRPLLSTGLCTREWLEGRRARRRRFGMKLGERSEERRV